MRIERICALVIVGLLFVMALALRETGPTGAAASGAEGPAGGGNEPPWQVEAFGCRLAARTARTKYNLDEPILVEVELKNVSAETHTIMSRRRPGSWAVRATDQLLKDVPPTRYGRYVRGDLPGYPRGGSVGGGPMPPGRAKREIIQLDRLCDFTMGGTYSVTVGKIIGNRTHHEWATLEAPPLTIHINGGWPSLSRAFQALALQEDPDRREVIFDSIGDILRRGIDVVRDSAVKDEDEGVRTAAREVLEQVREAAEAALKEEPDEEEPGQDETAPEPQREAAPRIPPE